MTGSVPAPAQMGAAGPEHRYGLATELRDRFRIVCTLDRISMARLRIQPWLIYAVGIVLAAFFALIRAAFFHTEEIPGHALIGYVYTESLVFLVIAFIAGLLTRIGGVLFTATFAVFDLIAWLFATDNYDPGPHLFSTIGIGQGLSPATFIGHLIYYVLLGLLVVTIPSLINGVAAELGSWRFGRPIAAVGAGVTAGVGVFGWLTAAPYLIRPIFGNYYPAQAIQDIQNNDVAFATLFAIIAGSLAFALGPRSALTALPVDLLPWRRWLHRLGPRVGPFVVYVGLFVFLAGVITSMIDVGILVVAAIVAELAGARVARIVPLAAAGRRLPYAARLLLMAGIATAIAFLVTSVTPEAQGDSVFLPLVIELAVAIIVFRSVFATAPVPVRDAGPGAAGMGVAGLLSFSAVSLAVAWLATPNSVFADNCGDWTDCRNGRNVFIAALAWLLLVGVPFVGNFLWSWAKGVLIPDPIGAAEPLLSPEGAEAEGGALDMMKNLAANNALAAGDTDEYSRIMNESRGDFAKEAASGKYR